MITGGITTEAIDVTTPGKTKEERGAITGGTTTEIISAITGGTTTETIKCDYRWDNYRNNKVRLQVGQLQDEGDLYLSFPHLLNIFNLTGF